MNSHRHTPGAPSYLALACVGFVASSFATPAAAQDAEAADQGATRLKGVVVTDTSIVDEVKVDRPESPKYVRPLLDTPQTVTVISNQTIRQQNLLTLRDALATLPGITFGAGEGGGGYGDSINLRGQSANTDITIDGVRDSAQYSRTDPFNLQQIEVINGANSVYSGSGSIGGTINLVTKRPIADDQTVLSAGIGTDNYYRATVDSNVRLSDLVAVRMNAMYHENDVPGRDFDSYERWGVAPSIKIGLDGPTSLTLLYLHQKDDNTPLYGVPYYKNAFSNGLPPGASYAGYYGYRNVDYQKQTIDQFTAIFEHAFNDSLSLRNLARWQRVEQNLVVDPPQGTYCLASGATATGEACGVGQQPGIYYPSGPRGSFRFSENQSLYDQVDLTFDFPGGHTLVFGGSYLLEDYDLVSGNVLRNPDGATPNPVLDPINIANPLAIYTGPLNPIRTGAQEGELTNAALYGFAAIKLSEQLELNGGIRYERNKATFRSDVVTPAALPVPAGQSGRYLRGEDQIANDNLFSYRIAGVFKPAANASLYVAYSNSRNPTATTVRSGCGLAAAANNFNDPCDANPEQAVNYEIGGKVELFDARLLLTAALFRNERTDFRVASNDPLVGNLPVNDGKNRVDGIVLGASGNITDAWTIFANYSYLDSKVKQSISDVLQGQGAFDPQAGNPMINTPKHSGSLFTTYTLPFGLQVGYGLTYQGSFYLNNARPTPATILYKSDAYTTHRAFFSYPVTEQLTAQVNVQNLTDKKYYTSIRNNGWATPGEGRSAVFSLYYNF
jgi:catecholate siderophore receptor